METENKPTVSAAEIEEKMEEKEETKNEEEAPAFAPLSAQDLAVLAINHLMIFRDLNRFDVFVVLPIDSYPFYLFHYLELSFILQTPLKNNWERLMRPIVDQLKLLIRFNPQTKCVELKVIV